MKRNSYVVPFSLSPLLPYWKKGIRHPDVFNNAVMSITHNDPNGAQIVKHSYNDSTNNIVEYLNSIDGNTEYNYDFLGQLISADHANQTDESYTYDANGNRIVANGSNYTTGDNNELTSDGNYTYTYDAEGNRTSKTNSAGTERELYTWDYRNRLTTVTKQTCDTTTATWTTVQIVEYTYDYNNIWIRKTVDTNGDGTADSKSIFIPEAYQAAVQLDDTDLTDSAGPTITHHYLWTPNQQDKLLADTTSTDVLWSLTDHLGTIRDILGVTTTHLIYDAFGNLTSGTNPLLFGYTGKAFDADTALQNNINRWYDATIGRWLSVDPIGFEGNDTNLYRYVGNSIFQLDALGLWKRIGNTEFYFSDSDDDTFVDLVDLARKDANMTPIDSVRNQFCIIPRLFFKGKRKVTIKGDKYTIADEERMKDAWEEGKPARCGLYDVSNIIDRYSKPKWGRYAIGIDNPRNYYIHNMEILSRKSITRLFKEKRLIKEIKTLSGEGKTPISALEIVGHSWIGMDRIGSAEPSKPTFSIHSLGDATEKRTWEDAKRGKLPPIGWFRTDAVIWFTGCHTNHLASLFAAKYLRGKASAKGTNAEIFAGWPPYFQDSTTKIKYPYYNTSPYWVTHYAQ